MILLVTALNLVWPASLLGASPEVAPWLFLPFFLCIPTFGPLTSHPQEAGGSDKHFLMSWLTYICSRKEGLEQFGPPEFSVSFSSAGHPCIIFFITTPAPSLFFSYCCAPLLRALHDNLYVSLLRKTLKILGPSVYQKLSLFLLMCITWGCPIIL